MRDVDAGLRVDAAGAPGCSWEQWDKRSTDPPQVHPALTPLKCIPGGGGGPPSGCRSVPFHLLSTAPNCPPTILQPPALARQPLVQPPEIVVAGALETAPQSASTPLPHSLHPHPCTTSTSKAQKTWPWTVVVLHGNQPAPAPPPSPESATPTGPPLRCTDKWSGRSRRIARTTMRLVVHLAIVGVAMICIIAYTLTNPNLGFQDDDFVRADPLKPSAVHHRPPTSQPAEPLAPKPDATATHPSASPGGGGASRAPALARVASPSPSPALVPLNPPDTAEAPVEAAAAAVPAKRKSRKSPGPTADAPARPKRAPARAAGGASGSRGSQDRPASNASKATGPQPNILFLFPDSWRYDFDGYPDDSLPPRTLVAPSSKGIVDPVEAPFLHPTAPSSVRPKHTPPLGVQAGLQAYRQGGRETCRQTGWPLVTLTLIIQASCPGPLFTTQHHCGGSPHHPSTPGRPPLPPQLIGQNFLRAFGQSKVFCSAFGAN